MSFLMATQSIQKSMGTISTLFGSIVRGSVAGARVFQYIQEKPHIRTEGGLTLSEVRGEVWHANANEPWRRFGLRILAVIMRWVSTNGMLLSRLAALASIHWWALQRHPGR
jgi:ABC-type multidrug transport system fused ATPase/permease subunit